jgi:hypothetical protein
MLRFWYPACMRIPLSKCHTSGCASTEAEAVTIGPPETVPLEPDLLQYEYDGYCPLCHVPVFGCFWVKQDRTTVEPKKE